MPITYTDAQNGKTKVVDVGPGFTPEQAAATMHLAPGTWRVITPEEAAELQKPSAEELTAARRAEIMARLDALSAELLPKDYTIVNAWCGDAKARAIVEAKRAAHEAAAEPLRAELRALAPVELEIEGPEAGLVPPGEEEEAGGEEEGGEDGPRLSPG